MTTAGNFSPALIHLDDALLVAEKPAGMLAVPGRGEDKQDCFSARIQQTFFDALAVHRLDMATSGLMVFARGREMHRRMSAMFRERRVRKKYIAVVAGQMPAAGEIDLPLGADWPNRPRQKVDFSIGKPSLTKYRLLEHNGGTNTSRIELEPLTGRTHQLRVHLAAIGHPIAGDALYGGCPSERLLLHACSLSFAHPLSGELVTATCDTPF
jgi:tRNA pseudouridine32 synthase/23S rRNA pseudouridine746 synthase